MWLSCLFTDLIKINVALFKSLLTLFHMHGICKAFKCNARMIQNPLEIWHFKGHFPSSQSGAKWQEMLMEYGVCFGSKHYKNTTFDQSRHVFISKTELWVTGKRNVLSMESTVASVYHKNASWNVLLTEATEPIAALKHAEYPAEIKIQQVKIPAYLTNRKTTTTTGNCRENTTTAWL